MRRLDEKMNDGFAKADEKIEDLKARVDKLDEKYDSKYDRLTLTLVASALGIVATHAL